MSNEEKTNPAQKKEEAKQPEKVAKTRGDPKCTLY